MSRISPAKTHMTPNHWRAISEFPNKRTDPRMVKNFRVVVIMEHVRGPKLATVMKMKFYKETRKKSKQTMYYICSLFFNPLMHVYDGFG